MLDTGAHSIHAAEPGREPRRCAIVVDAALPPGRAANAAAVTALTLGQRHPEAVGRDLVDAGGQTHPGLIPIGIAILAAPAAELPGIRDKALKAGIDVVDFPSQGQETNDYADFRTRVSQVATGALTYVSIGLFGPRKAVGRVIGKYSLLK